MATSGEGNEVADQLRAAGQVAEQVLAAGPSSARAPQGVRSRGPASRSPQRQKSTAWVLEQRHWERQQQAGAGGSPPEATAAEGGQAAAGQEGSTAGAAAEG